MSFNKEQTEQTTATMSEKQTKKERRKRWFIRFIIVMTGISCGIAFLPWLWKLTQVQVPFLQWTITNAAIGGFIFFFLALLFEKKVIGFMKRLELSMKKKSLTSLIGYTIGGVLGLIIGALLSLPFYRLQLPFVNNVIPACIMLVCGYLGYYIIKTKGEEVNHLFRKQEKPKNNAKEGEILERKAGDTFRRYKILDTSVIIDGRIYDIAKTGFIDGTLVIPKFVLYELQYIADSADSLKRVRGRRGLDILNELQKEEGIAVEMYEGDFPDIEEVDTKLIKLAKVLDGVVVTNDFNLNKVCEFQNVPVLNINALANAVKPVVIPGEQMTVTIVKEGTEREQGVAYLDDGTMIVVEEGKHYMKKTLPVIVTTALQTAAGRMIFARPLHMRKNLKENTKED